VIVIDSSSLAKYLLREAGWEVISQYIRRGSVYSLDHALKEVSNAIWRHYCLKKAIEASKAKELYQALRKLIKAGAIILESEEQYIDEAVEISIEHHLTVYDSLYIAQAFHRRNALLTSDEKQAKIAEKMNIHTILT